MTLVLRLRLSRLALVGSFLGLALVSASCGSDDDGDSFILQSTLGSVSSANLVVEGNWLVYFDDEALVGVGGAQLNGDADAVDQVPVAVRMGGGIEFVLPVASATAAIVGGEVYLQVIEAEDEVDWNGMNGTLDTVLLRWSEAAGVLTYVDTLRSGSLAPPFVATEDRLYYATAIPAGLPDETAIRYLAVALPTQPVIVSAVPLTGPADAAILGEDQGLLFVALDETTTASDFNGDGDALDASVLGLLDSTSSTALVQNARLALADTSAPWAARTIATADWIVAFLVNEAAQGSTSLNDDSPPAFGGPLLPSTCNPNDDDVDDDVLHYLEFASFVQGLAPAVNTGLAGRDRVLAATGFVATLTDEADTTNPCDLNGDGDTSDTVVRWVETVVPVVPPRDPTQLHAIATSVPGGSRGFARLEERIVAVVDEAADGRDHDAKPQAHELVAWLDPADGITALWTFAHQDPNASSIGTAIFEDVDGNGVPDPGQGASEPYAGASWMASDEQSSRLGVAFQEEVPGTNPLVPSLNNNLDCGVVLKDTDRTDSLPVWADFEFGPVLDFDGVGFALDPVDPGIVIAGGQAFFRVDEAADSIDHNRDGVLDDRVLMRNPLVTCGPNVLATLSSLSGPAVVTDGELGAALVASESAAGEDYNKDGDTNDLVVRFFLF